MRATPLICVALVCITVFTAIATATEKTGLFVWSQSIIQGDADYTDELQQQLLTFMDGGGGTAAVDASLEGGRIIQDGALDPLHLPGWQAPSSSSPPTSARSMEQVTDFR